MFIEIIFRLNSSSSPHSAGPFARRLVRRRGIAHETAAASWVVARLFACIGAGLINLQCL